MKALTKTLTIFSLLFSVTVFAKQYQQDKDYFVVNEQASSSPSITEVFSFYCPACFRMEPFMAELKEMISGEGEFKKSHVDNMPGRNKNSEQLLTKALITARLLKVEAPITADIFNTIHRQRGDFSTLNDIKPLFKKQGISAEKFEKTFNSFTVRGEFARMQKTMNMLRQQGIGSVPTLIINGKYVPNTKSLRSIDEYKALINHLLTKSS